MLSWKTEEATDIRKRVRFAFMDKPDKSRTVDLNSPQARVIPKDDAPADLVVSTTSGTMENILSGSFNAREAVKDGSIDLKSDVGRLRQVCFLFAARGKHPGG